MKPPNTEPSDDSNESEDFNPKIAAARSELLKNVVAGDIKKIRDKVAFILNNNTKARNSDKELAWDYWKTFQSDILKGDNINKDQLFKLTKMTSLVRVRAKIQNEFKLFQADAKIRRQRGKLAEDYKDEAISEKPDDLPIYQVYMDESGKTQEYLSVGSLWVIDGYPAVETHLEITKWKKEQDINYEFHFNKVSNAKLAHYKTFFQKFLSLNPSVGFKVILLSNKGIKHQQITITDLTYHLIDQGIDHEHSTLRAELPRLLQVYFDREEEGSDQIKVANIKERLKSQKIEGLYIGDIEAIDSANSTYIQIVDLFVAAVNRKIHPNESTGNAKDELAEFIFDILSLEVSESDLLNRTVDKSRVFNLLPKGQSK